MKLVIALLASTTAADAASFGCVGLADDISISFAVQGTEGVLSYLGGETRERQYVELQCNEEGICLDHFRGPNADYYVSKGQISERHSLIFVDGDFLTWTTSKPGPFPELPLLSVEYHEVTCVEG